MSVIEVSITGIFLSRLCLRLTSGKVFSRGVFLRRLRPCLVGSRVFLMGCSIGCSFSCSIGCSFGCSLGCSFSCSSSISLFNSSLVSAYKYGFTVVDLKSVGLLGNCTLHVSPLRASKVYGLVHLPLWPILPSR
jgi:hypothetical protein